MKTVNVEPKQILRKSSLISKMKKRKLKKEKRKQWKDLERHENVRGKMKVALTGDKNKVEGLVKWLVFFKKNLNKVVNLDRKTCKNKTMKVKLGKDSITSSLNKKCKLSKVRQSNPCNNSRVRSWLCCCKYSSVFQVNCVRFCFRDCI